MNADYYADILNRLRNPVKRKQRGKLWRSVLLQCDNALVHICNVAVRAVHRYGFTKLPHPTYSPDLCPSKYLPFSKLKKKLFGERFDDYNELKMDLEGYFREQRSSFYSTGIYALQARWHICLELEGDYVE